MKSPKSIQTVVLDGHSLILEEFIAVARHDARVELAPAAKEAMERSRALAEKIAGEKRVAYGITTGFGDFATVAVSDEMSSQLSTNLILSHCTATGEPYREEQVRGMMRDLALLPLWYAGAGEKVWIADRKAMDYAVLC